jgi:D-inositol-3-phosphate glycosyltransferase
MRIAFISYWTCPLARPGVLTAGGMNVYILQVAQALGNIGIQIEIYTRKHKEDKRIVVQLSKNVRVIHIPQKEKDIYKDIQNFSNLVIQFINQSNLKYDLIHGHYYYSSLVGIKLKQKLKIPLVTTFHTLGVLKQIYGGIHDRKRIRSEEYIIKETDRIFVFTQIEKNDLIDHYHAQSDKIRIIPPGVNHSLFYPHNKKISRKKLDLHPTKKIILFIGRIDPIKGITFLIESIAHLVQMNPVFKNKFLVLLVGGDVKSREFQNNKEVIQIKKLIYEKDLDCCVRFISSQPHHILPLYYSSSDLVVMPSVYESFGLVVLEAMATGAPVIATKVGGLQYLISDKHTGRLFESRNIPQLANIINELFSDEKQRLRLGKSAQKQSLNFCWDKQAIKILKEYKTLI